MARKLNVVKTDITSYPPYIIMSPPKAGKTTLFRDLVLYNYGVPEAGLLISCGNEEGYHALSDLYYEVAEEFDTEEDEVTGLKGFKQIIDDVIENNKEYGIKMVCIDTLDTFIDILSKEVIRQSLIETGKVCKSLNDALGGFQKGRDRLVDIAQEQIGKLRKAGIAVFILAHTKFKDKTDPMSGNTYEQLTNNLRSDYWSPFANAAQMIVNINIEKQIEENKLIGEKRYLVFRNTGLIDAGGRFTDLPEKLELSAENFMKAFEQGVKSSMGKQVSDTEIEQQKQKEVQEREEKVSKAAEPTLEELITKIKDVMKVGIKNKTLTNPQIMELLGKYSLKSPDAINSIDLAKFVLADLK